MASSFVTPCSAASCPSCVCRSGVNDENAVVKSPVTMAFTQARAAWPEPANWPLSAPLESPPIEPPGLVGGGSAPPGRLMSVSIGIIGAEELLDDELELDAVVEELVLAAVALLSSLFRTTNSTTPAATRTTTTAAMIHGRGLFFGGCPEGP